MSKNVREILERVHSKDIFIDSALSSLAELIRGGKKKFDSQAKTIEESKKNTDIYNSAIDHIVKMIEEG